MTKTSFKNLIATILLLAFLIAIFAFASVDVQASSEETPANTSVHTLKPDLQWSRTTEAAVAYQVINTPVTYDYVSTIDFSRMENVWDNGTDFGGYYSGTGLGRNFASWPRLSIKGSGMVDQRRFHASYSVPEGRQVVSARVESKSMGSVISINDNIYIFINGNLWYGGSGSSPENLSRRNKTLFPETHGWNIDMGNLASMEITNDPSSINVDVLAQDYDTGGGMCELQLIIEYKELSALNDSYTTPYNTKLEIGEPGIMVNDLYDGEGTKADVVTTTSNGALSVNSDGSFEYTPNVGFSGNDMFTYRLMSSSEDYSNTATVNITVGEPTPPTPPTPTPTPTPVPTPTPTPPVNTVTLTTSTIGQGTILPGPGNTSYAVGTTVQLSPKAADGWKFTGWQGDAVDGNNQIYMGNDKAVTAVFEQIIVVVPPVVVPEAAPVVVEPAVEEITEELVPQAPAELPKTGGLPAGLMYGFGGLLSVAGIILKKIKK